ncbi:unnamed protein product [Rhodiola kirilowii]
MVSRATLWHAAFGAAVMTIGIVSVIVRFCKKPKRSEFETARASKMESGVKPNQQQLIASLHAQAAVIESSRRRPSLNGFRRGGANKPLFSWADNPFLTNDAIETGWARFAFTLSPAVKPTSILGMCATGELPNGALETEISWEIGHGSVDFMQKIRLNSGMRRFGSNSNSSGSILSTIRTALPLPGPPCAFPQEAYFEIMILSCREEDEVESIKIREVERMKLIRENGGSVHTSSDSSIPAMGARDEGRSDSGGGEPLVAVGLTVGGLLPMKIPGSYAGSIGFSSNGSLYHVGNKLVSESEKGEWGMLTGMVIGCGFVPSQKKVFFTIDSEIVHTISCTTDEFGTPLYPTLAANCDVTLSINNGQSPFKYVPANATRRPNPCFIESSSRDTFCEDSRELFSMGRIDSQWHNRSIVRRSLYAGNASTRAKDYDEESDVDELFEIILEGSCGTPPCVGR